jgi:hypothetical protein
MKHTAIAYIRRDIAPGHAARYEAELRSLARNRGLDLSRTILDTEQCAGLRQLRRLIRSADADPELVVLLPSLSHVEGTLDDIGECAAVETLIPSRRWSRLQAEGGR